VAHLTGKFNIMTFMKNLRILAALILCGVMASAADAPVQPSANKNLRVKMGGAETGRSIFAPDPQKERELLDKIQSPTVAASEKAMSCKLLTIHGTARSVPVLAPLLADPQLASWARIALEAIPDHASDAALRDAAGRLDGLPLVGVINSIGERRDPKAVSLLSKKLKASDPAVASASAVALGKIGGSGPAKTLLAALKQAGSSTGAGIAEGCIRCAEQFLASNQAPRARKLYDAVREANVPPNKRDEALRGAILARGDEGIPLMIEALRSTDPDQLAIGLSVARELPGTNASHAVAQEVRRATGSRQPLLFLALADRNDPATLSSIVDAAQSGDKALRLAAVGVLERMGDNSVLPVLIQVACQPDTAVSQAAIAAMTRLPSEEVSLDIQKRLATATGKELEALIRVAGQRQIKGALPFILAAASGSNIAVRGAALQSLSTLGDEKQVPELIQVLNGASDARQRGEIESALIAISARNRTAVPAIAPLAHSPDAALRSLALKCLSASGGPAALEGVMSALKDADPELQDEAVRTLATWPNTWPEDGAVAGTLLELAGTGAKPSHQVLAMRGYIQYVEGDTKLPPPEKVTRLREAVPLMKRTEEKRMAISVLSEQTTPDAVDLLLSLAEDEAVREDACSGLVKLGSRSIAGLANEDRKRALEAALRKSADEATRKRAEERLKGMM
jgi:HEAT repeat protein